MIDAEPWLHDDGTRGPKRRGEYLPIGQLESRYDPRPTWLFGEPAVEYGEAVREWEARQARTDAGE